MHTVPLARQGWRVVALDTSAHLLSELQQAVPGLPVSVHPADLRAFESCLADADRPDLIICMGDTLTHLPEPADVAALLARVARRLAPGGRFVATFRDFTRLPMGEARFIPVRAEATRILTCFLEDLGDRVRVHDLLHERADAEAPWTLRLGSYPKLKLAPAALLAMCEGARLRAVVAPGARGMLRLVAEA